jgi:subtilase family serine protease
LKFGRTEVRRVGRRTALVAGALCAALATPVVPAAAAPTGVFDGRHAIAGDRPEWTARASDAGPVDPATALSVRVYLAGRDPRGLASYAVAVSDPGGPMFRRYLSPTEVRARFGPTAAQVGRVRGWLGAAGLTVTGVNQHYVAARGTAAAAQRAFGVVEHGYRLSGKTYHAPTGTASVPAAVGADVLGVSGLDDKPSLARPADAPLGPPTANLRAKPCSLSFGQNPATTEPQLYGQTGSWVDCGLTPRDIRTAYGLEPDPTAGAGVTIAITDAYASATILSDVASYTSAHGTPNFTPGQFTQNLPPAWTDVAGCGGTGWENEEDIDVDAVHNVAPGAKIVYVAGASCSDADLTDAMARVVDDKLATIVSNSWLDLGDDSITPAVRAAYDQVFQQGAAEGIGFYFSSGDCGANDPATPCGAGEGSTAPQSTFPADDPWVTGVGGTTVALNRYGHQMWQAGWGISRSDLTADGRSWTPAPGTGYPATYRGGAGGGASAEYAQPAYQAGVVPAAMAETQPDGTRTAAPMRVAPDVSMDADNDTGMLVGQTVVLADGTTEYTEIRWGGTSLACPLFAGVQALAQADTGVPIGFANPQIYQIYARYGAAAYQDVTDTPLGPSVPLGVVRNDYTNAADPTSPVTTRAYSFGHDGLLHAVAGYDEVTGIGTPAVPGLLSAYAKLAGTSH